MTRRPMITLALAGAATIASASLATATGVSAAPTVNNSAKTTSPIKHVVVIYQENVSFDHYFGTYPKATNTDGQPFTAKPLTPAVNGLTRELLTANPNGVNPQRLGASNILTCDQNHNYTPEQQALDGGLMDKFPTYTQVESCSPPDTAPPGLVMDYYDGNTVTALWNYAQRFAMSDNNFDTTFGPSTPGVLNLVSGQTHGATPAVLAGVTNNGTDYGDADPTFDECSAGSTIAMSGTNIGNELNAKHVTWGWFQGGFAPTGQNHGTVVCGSSHVRRVRDLSGRRLRGIHPRVRVQPGTRARPPGGGWI
jgi:phospholipase C